MAAYPEMHLFNLFEAQTPLPLMGWALVFFAVIYLMFSTLAWRLAMAVNRPLETRPLSPGQIRLEMLNSARSIWLFAVAMVFPWVFYQWGWVNIDSSRDWLRIATEMGLLVIWNDMHFYALHRLMHTRLRKIHVHHHRSIRATPFASYSMGWVEALLLGSVLPLAMLMHDFTAPALLFLPLWSLFINTLSHSNCDFFPSAKPASVLGFVRHHQSHHSNYHGNYAFFISRLDAWFGTTRESKQPEQT